jgi:P4 family phage/plasmid primase-like protien
MLDRDQALAFIEALTGSHTTICVFQLADDVSTCPSCRAWGLKTTTCACGNTFVARAQRELSRVLIGRFDELQPALDKLNTIGAAIWLQINEGRRGAPNVTGIRACFVDDDGKSLLAPIWRLPPGIIVSSSSDKRKQHAYWPTVPGQPLERFVTTQKRLIAALKTDKSIHNLDRVMRLPGSCNWKYGEPQPCRLLHADRSRLFTFDELIAAHPVDELEEPTAGSLTVESSAPEARAVASRIGHWLTARDIRFETVTPISFRLRCPFNATHGNKLMIRIQSRGGIWAGCWHDSCGGNRNRWPAVKDAIGGWQDGQTSFSRGDDVELARRLIVDLGASSEQGLVGDRDQLWRYESDGLWHALPAAQQEQLIASYAGAQLGEKRRVCVHASTLKGAVQCARSLAAAPGFFDDVGAGIAFANGFLAVTPAGPALVPHAPEHRQTVGLPFNYDEHAKPVRWLQYLAEVFAPDLDAEDKIKLVQEFLGACLVGIATRYQKCLLLIGEGSNGKSVLTSVAHALFPATVRASIKPQDFGLEYYRATLAGVRINVVSETPEADILSSDAFNAIVTGDAIMARWPYGHPFNVSCVAGHIFSANRLPGTSNYTEGFFRRFILLGFNRRFGAAERDTELATRIAASELPAIAGWAVLGAARLQAQGAYTEPASEQTAKAQWRQEVDPVAAFVNDACAADSNGTQSTPLYEAFRAWSHAKGYRLLSHATFVRRLRGLGHTSEHRRTGEWYLLHCAYSANSSYLQ